MFDFEKLEVYQICKTQNIEVLEFISTARDIDDYLLAKWKDCAINAVLFLVEGIGRIPKQDKKTFITQARGYVFECVAILDMIKITHPQYEDQLNLFYERYESLSKMMLGMIRSFDAPQMPQ